MVAIEVGTLHSEQETIDEGLLRNEELPFEGRKEVIDQEVISYVNQGDSMKGDDCEIDVPEKPLDPEQLNELEGTGTPST